MSKPENLEDLYIDELKDLWSANDQMGRALKKLVKKISDETLKEMIENSQAGIEKHTEVLKELIKDAGEKVSKEHCKGMEGLVTEATKHLVEEAPDKGPVWDAVMIAQYQRMSHYGIAGFGTAKAYAEALGEKDAVKKLDKATAEIYRCDEYGTKLAESSVNLKAADEE